MSQISLMASDNNAQNATNRGNIVMLEARLSDGSRTYCVERERLARKSVWFRAMLAGPLTASVSDMSSPPIFRLQHVDKRVFDHFLRYLHDEPINFTSVSTAKATLDIAYQYLCPELAKLAAKYLNENLTNLTVLEIYKGLVLYASGSTRDFDRSLFSTSALPPENVANEIAAVCADLLLNCLFLIDLNPVAVLRQERFEQLSIQEVALLANRNTLNLNSECILFSALDRWATAECHRQGLQPLPFNKRAVLSDEVCFSVRYLLMNDVEFVSGPMASGILTNEECVYIVSRILKHPESSLDNDIRSSLEVYPSMLSDAPRVGTSRIDPSRVSRYIGDDQECRMLKPGKKERQDNRKNRRKECASQGQRTCARIGHCLIQILSCVFD